MKTIPAATAPHGGISAATYDTYNGRLVVRGWLMPAAETVEVIWDDGTTMTAATGLRRADVVAQYDAAALVRPGWAVDSACATPPAVRGFRVRARMAGGVTWETRGQLVVDDTRARIAAKLARRARRPAPAPLSPSEACRRLRLRFGPAAVRTERLDPARYAAYLAAADYGANYPLYCEEFGPRLPDKTLEHFLSLELMPPRADGTYVDVAASASPFAAILGRLYGVGAALAQDQTYPPGRGDGRIGSDAARIPLPGASCDGLTLHNSWEHFEGESDILFLFEAARLLRPGGVAVILPVVMSEITTVTTSPSVWFSKYGNTDRTPDFDPRATVVVAEDIRQRQEKTLAVDDLAADLALLPDLDVEFVFFQDPDGGDVLPGPALVARRRAAAVDSFDAAEAYDRAHAHLIRHEWDQARTLFARSARPEAAAIAAVLDATRDQPPAAVAAALAELHVAPPDFVAEMALTRLRAAPADAGTTALARIPLRPDQLDMCLIAGLDVGQDLPPAVERHLLDAPREPAALLARLDRGDHDGPCDAASVAAVLRSHRQGEALARVYCRIEFRDGHFSHFLAATDHFGLYAGEEMRRATAQLALGDFDAADATIAAIAAAQPDHPLLARLRAELARRTGDIAAARRIVDAFAPDHPVLLAERAKQHLHDGDAETAAAIFARLAAADPASPGPALWLALLDGLAGRDDQAAIRLRQLAARPRRRPHVMVMAGLSLLDDAAGAMRWWRRARAGDALAATAARMAWLDSQWA